MAGEGERWERKRVLCRFGASVVTDSEATGSVSTGSRVRPNSGILATS